MAFNNIHQFEITIIGAITETPWVGKFKSKIHLGLSEDMSYNRKKKELLGPDFVVKDDVTQELDNKAEALAMVQARLVEWPQWWAEMRMGADMLDWNVLYGVYGQVMDPWVKDMKARQEKAQKQAPQLRAEEDKKDGLV
jgi:hypothetical protein